MRSYNAANEQKNPTIKLKFIFFLYLFKFCLKINIIPSKTQLPYSPNLILDLNNVVWLGWVHIQFVKNVSQKSIHELIISHKTTFTVAPGLLSAQGGRHLKSGSIISYQMECKQNQRDNFQHRDNNNATTREGCCDKQKMEAVGV